MRTFARWTFVALWTMIATLALSIVWMRWLAPIFPFPESFWFWIFTNVPGFWDGEAGDDLEILVHLVFSLVVVMLGTWLGHRYFRARRRSAASLR